MPNKLFRRPCSVLFPCRFNRQHQTKGPRMKRAKRPVFRFVAGCELPISEGLGFPLSHDQVIMNQQRYIGFLIGCSRRKPPVSADAERTKHTVMSRHQKAGQHSQVSPCAYLSTMHYVQGSGGIAPGILNIVDRDESL
jgi:hypothetical protein